MAVAGLPNVSVVNSSLSIEAQSPLSKWCSNHEKPSNHASSLLQMWRELEVEHITSNSQPQVGEQLMQGSVSQSNTNFSSTCLSTVVGHDSAYNLVDSNEKENDCIIPPRGSQNEYDDSRSSSSESVDFSKVERERVREVFREWQNNGLRNNSTSDSHQKNCSKAQWLGDKECERVRIVREWVEKTTQQRSRYHGGREGQDSETGAQIDLVREGLIVDHCEDKPRRTIRRLCGRQTLLDLLMRAEDERRRELQDLLKHRHVSNFAYRNRIQSLLKGRFLKNKTYNQEEKPCSLAASELGILREKQTVSGLREGFLTSVSGPVGSARSNNLSHKDTHCHGNEQTRANCLQDTSEETDTNISYTEDSECDVSESLRLQESEALVSGSHGVLESNDTDQLSTFEYNARRKCASENSWGSSVDGGWPETLGIEGSQQGTLLEARISRFDPQRNERDGPSGASNYEIDQLEGTVIEDMSWQNIPLELEDWQDSVIEEGDIDWVQLSSGNYTEWRQASEDGVDTHSHASTQQYQLQNDGEHYHMQVLHEEWHDNASDDARNDWSGEPLGEEFAVADISHFSDDDNGQSLELRQLVSRRRVSNLLRSDFRASLDQLIQSYVERRDHASADWEVDEASSSSVAVLEEQEQIDHLHISQSESYLSTTLPPVILPSPHMASSETAWDHNSNQQQANSLQQGSIDWEVVNGLRVDMAWLHQRMNSMQTMLEACMDMQLELQRSVRQEVSAALNWQSRSADCEDNFIPDESKLEHVKKGICCICCDAKIDSLLYRCGHMCSCSKCAHKLVEGKDKCPVCRAPVIEVIRAYFIQ